jgi:hypothetical protein
LIDAIGKRIVNRTFTQLDYFVLEARTASFDLVDEFLQYPKFLYENFVGQISWLTTNKDLSGLHRASPLYFYSLAFSSLLSVVRFHSPRSLHSRLKVRFEI